MTDCRTMEGRPQPPDLSYPGAMAASPEQRAPRQGPCDGQGEGQNPGCCGAGERGRLVCLLMLCNSVLYVNRANMAVAVTFMYSEDQLGDRAKVLAAFYCGYPIVQVIAGHWSTRHGGKRVLLVAAVLWSVATLLVIPAYYLGPWAVCAARALVGLSEGVNYPAQTALLSAWIPLNERGSAFSILASGESIGTVVAMLGCAYLAQIAGWQAIFFISSGLGVLWTCAFAFFTAPTAEASKWITATELEYIQRHRGDLSLSAPPAWKAVPWSQFFRSRALWAIIVPHICFNWGYFLLLNVLPDYFQAALHTDYDDMGILSLLPYASLFVFDVLWGRLADKFLLERLKLRLATVRKISTTVGLGGAGVFFLLLRSVPECSAEPCPSRPRAVGLVIGAVAIGGASFSGVQVNFLDISPRFAAQLMGISNTLASFPGIFGVMSLAWFGGSFSATFAFAAGMELFGAVWYLLLGRAEDQHYSKARTGQLCSEDSRL